MSLLFWLHLLQAKSNKVGQQRFVSGKLNHFYFDSFTLNLLSSAKAEVGDSTSVFLLQGVSKILKVKTTN